MFITDAILAAATSTSGSPWPRCCSSAAAAAAPFRRRWCRWFGFDRGGAYAQVFRHCRDQGVHWVTYRRAPLEVPAMLPVITAITAGGRRREIT
jgi:hypothetical protein